MKFLFSLLLALSASGAHAWQVTYLANEGVLIEHDDKAVLIDALFGDGIPGYSVVGSELRRELESAVGVYADVDLVLATHFHRDHFDAAAVTRHLQANPEALFVSTPDAVSQLSETVAARGVFPKEGERESLNHREIRLTVLNLHHGRNRSHIQNLGFVVEIGEARFLHVGDTELTLEEWRQLSLPELQLTVALLPAWQITAAKLRAVGAERAVAFHLADASAPRSWFGSHGSREKRIAALREVAGVEIFESPGQVLKNQ